MRQSEFVQIDWRQAGYVAHPHLHGRPPAGTYAERLWSIGWNQAQKDLECSDQEWEFGRPTYFAEYDF